MLIEKNDIYRYLKSRKIENGDFRNFGLKLAFLVKIEKFFKIPKRRTKTKTKQTYVRAKN